MRSNPKFLIGIAGAVLALLISAFGFLGEVQAQTTGDPAKGKTVFARTCTGCHLNNGLDAGGRGPQLAGKDRPATGLQNRIRNGGVNMPAFSTSQISDAELPDLIAYVQSLGPSAAATTTTNQPALPASGVGMETGYNGFNPMGLILVLLAVTGISGITIAWRSRRTSR
jgi:mono/diheme cytochrome c family protein